MHHYTKLNLDAITLGSHCNTKLRYNARNIESFRFWNILIRILQFFCLKSHFKTVGYNNNNIFWSWNIIWTCSRPELYCVTCVHQVCNGLLVPLLSVQASTVLLLVLVRKCASSLLYCKCTIGSTLVKLGTQEPHVLSRTWYNTESCKRNTKKTKMWMCI
jgi:hypothetical protein